MRRGGFQIRARPPGWFRWLAVLGVVTAIAAIGAPAALSAAQHTFTATYTGHGSRTVSGVNASGSVTATGSGTVGRGTLTGSGNGVFASTTCLVFSGTGVLKGTRGTITVAAHRARACAASASATSFSFSGSVRVTGGTSTFAHARGTLSFRGSYLRQTSAVTISFRGRIAF
jgi:hypothetical protein